MSKVIEIPHHIKVYETSSDGLIKRLLAVLTVYTKDDATLPPEWRNSLTIEVE